MTNHSRPGNWNAFSPSYLCLGATQGGDIDPHIFTDEDGSRYLVWKSDDNRLGLPVTHIWAVQVSISSAGVSLIGKPQVLLDSTELWWAAIDYVPDGHLIEGPEIIWRNPYYYLFFAAAAYCSPSYSEGVARSKSMWGPYEKLHIPILSTGIVGSVNRSKLIGPGHASFVKDPKNEWIAVWHASFPGETCVRSAFVSYLQWGADDWPYIVSH
jgi:arabinan endo-1,5-alpha-L-arabinosidase